MGTCARCGGRGFTSGPLRDEAAPKGSCGRCGGEGWGWDGHDGYWTCPDCGGAGSRTSCPDCSGRGVTAPEGGGNCPVCHGEGVHWNGTDGYSSCWKCGGSGSVG